MKIEGHEIRGKKQMGDKSGAEQKRISDDARSRVQPMNEHLRFEMLISDLSARLVNILPDQTDREIERALHQVLEFFQVDRCGLLRISPDRKMVHVSHAAYAEGIERVSGDIDLAALFPWSYEKLVIQGLPVSFASVEELPDTAEQDRVSCIAMGIRSYLDIPLFFDGRVSAIIVINAVHKACRWPAEYIPRLRLLGEIFINALKRRNADRVLRESEARLSLAIESAGVMPWDLDVASGRLWTTEKAKEFFGFAPDSDTSLESFFIVVHPEDRENVRRAVELTIQSGGENHIEYRIMQPDGGIRWVASRGRMYPTSSEGAARLMGVSADITERKGMEESLRESKARLISAIDIAELGFYEMRENHRISFMDNRMRAFLGITLKEEPQARELWLARIHPDDLPTVREASRKVLEEGLDRFAVEYRYMHPQRGLTWLHHLSRVLERDAAGRALRVVGVMQDLSGRKQAETARWESMERYRAVVDAFDGFLYICSPDYRIEFMNQSLIERTGHDAVGERCYRVLHDRDSVCEWCVNERVFQGETVRWEVQSPKDNRWYYVANTPIRHADGTISKQAMIMDITERKQAEETLEESRVQSLAVVNSTDDLIWSVDPERFGLLTWNRAFRDYFFKRRGIEVAVGMTPEELVPPDYVALWHELFARALREGSFSTEYVVVAKTNVLLLSLHNLKRGNNVFGISVFGKDITERKQAEQALRESEAALRNSKQDLHKLTGKLIAAREDELRRLSRELHDDLTQRLAVIAIEAGKLELELGKAPHARADVLPQLSRMKEQLITVSEDVHRISRQLHPTILDDLGLIRAIESECATLLRQEDMQITFIKDGDFSVVAKDVALCLYRIVQEGLKNILKHSQTRRADLYLNVDGDRIYLTVRDKGAGFDPREVRQKPGLGLSSMRERVQLVCGEFSIEARPGQGAAIRVCIPLKGDGS